MTKKVLLEGQEPQNQSQTIETFYDLKYRNEGSRSVFKDSKLEIGIEIGLCKPLLAVVLFLFIIQYFNYCRVLGVL